MVAIRRKPMPVSEMPLFRQPYLKVKEKVRLDSPAMIVGLPGIGLVSKLAADNLVRVLGARHFATLYSPHFPNQVVALKSGRLRLFGMHLFHGKLGQRDVVIVKGDLQPLTVEGQYEVSASLLSLFAGMGGREVIAMAGYATNAVKEKPGVFAAASSKGYFGAFTKLGAKPLSTPVPIVGMAGMLPGLSKLYGMRGVCLLVETPGPIVDANGAKTLTEIIGKYFKAKIGSAKLSARAKKAGALIAEFEKQAKEAAQQQQPPFPAVPKDVSYIR